MQLLRTFLLLALASIGSLYAEDAKPAQILFFTKSQRFEHPVIKQIQEGKASFVEGVLAEMGVKGNFKVTTTKDGGAFTAENLAKYDALMLYTSGNLLLPAKETKDNSPPMTPEGKQLFIDSVKQGKPLIIVHNALATFDRLPNDQTDPYVEMIGGESIGHNEQQKARNTCVDPKFPGAEDLKDGLEMMEEWYSNKHFSKDIHVILVQETRDMKGPLYQRPPYPSTWARMFGKGRVFVTSIGHREDVWTNPVFQKLLNGGIQWSLGRVEVDLTPNLETVTPKYAELPAPTPPKAK